MVYAKHTGETNNLRDLTKMEYYLKKKNLSFVYQAETFRTERIFQSFFFIYCCFNRYGGEHRIQINRIKHPKIYWCTCNDLWGIVSCFVEVNTLWMGFEMEFANYVRITYWWVHIQNILFLLDVKNIHLGVRAKSDIHSWYKLENYENFTHAYANWISHSNVMPLFSDFFVFMQSICPFHFKSPINSHKRRMILICPIDIRINIHCCL